MKVLELFSGTRSIGKAFEAAGHEVFSIDFDTQFEADAHVDIYTLDRRAVLELTGWLPDVVWASPDCSSYSVAALSHHRIKVNSRFMPKSERAARMDAGNAYLIEHLLPEITPVFLIENPRGIMRHKHFVKGLHRHTVTYCQYGDSSMKPTDIFTNVYLPYPFKPACSAGGACHIPSKKGATIKGSTQWRSKKDRGRIPQELCEEIVDMCEKIKENRS